MAKHKKKRPGEGRLKVIAGGGAVKAVLPGKGPQWKAAKDRAQAPSTGAHAASTSKSVGPRNRRRDEADDESSAAEGDRSSVPARKGIPRRYIYGAIGVVVLVVAYFLLRNPPNPGRPGGGVENPSASASHSVAAETSSAPPASSIVLPASSQGSPASSLATPEASQAAPASSQATPEASKAPPASSLASPHPVEAPQKPEEPSEYE